MDVEEANRILELATLGEQGINVEFLMKPERFAVMIFMAPRSNRSRAIAVDLLVVERHGICETKSLRGRYVSPDKALDDLTMRILPSRHETATVAPSFREWAREIHSASQCDRFDEAYRRMRAASPD